MRFLPSYFTASALLCSLCAAVAAPLAHADFTYDYQSPDYNTVSGDFNTSESVSGQFTIPALATEQDFGYVIPTSFTFANGIATSTNLNSTITLQLFTDSLGQVSRFLFDIQGPAEIDAEPNGGPHGLPYVSTFSDEGNGLAYGEGRVTLQTATTPEPSSIALLGTGILGVAGVARKRFA